MRILVTGGGGLLESKFVAVIKSLHEILILLNVRRRNRA